MSQSIPTLPLETPRRLLALCFALTAIGALGWPWIDPSRDATGLGIALWVLGALAMSTLLLEAVVTWRTSARPVPPLPQPQAATDVLLWAGRHPIGVLRQALRSAQALAGPHRVYLLAQRPEGAERLQALHALADELRCTLVRCDGGTDDAAALANQALALGDAPFIAWLDGSHACRRDFLQRTLGHFSDARLAFVQTAPGVPGERVPGSRAPEARQAGPWQRWMAAFSPALARRAWHLGWDRWQATPWTGSGAVLRREALQAAGGFTGRGADLFARSTAQLQRHGLHGLWHAERMAFSVAPEDEGTRIDTPTSADAWSALLRGGALHRPGMTLAQRLRHLADAAAASLWVPTAAALSIPALAILAGAVPPTGNTLGLGPGQAAMLAAALVLGGLLHTELSAGAHGTLQRLAHRIARLDPALPSLLMVLNAVAVTAGAARALSATSQASATVSGPSIAWLGLVAWSALNLLLLASARLAAQRDTGKVRRNQRFAVTLAAELSDGSGARVMGTVDDLSRHGLRFYGPLLPAMALNQQLLCTLHLPDGPLAVTGEVRHLGVRNADSMHQPRCVGLMIRPSLARKRRIDTYLFSSDLQWQLQGHVEQPVTPLARLFPGSFRTPPAVLARRRWNGAQLRPHVHAEATPLLCAAPAPGDPEDSELLVSHAPLPEQVPMILDVFRRRAKPSRPMMLRRIDDPAGAGVGSSALYAYRAVPAEMPAVPADLMAAASPFVLVEDAPLVLEGELAARPTGVAGTRERAQVVMA